MRRVTFDPTTLQGEDQVWWARWSARADAARHAYASELRNGQQPGFVSTIWTDLKRFLLGRAFHGKCGYCESRIVGISYGDADHYRPKGRVTVVDATGARAVVMQNNAPHRGYFWLAYDWRNLIPSCQDCNAAGGKVDQFPVAGTHCFEELDTAGNMIDLDQVEQPLLLHPYRDDGHDHLRFGAKGVVAAAAESPRGEASIKVYNLSRDGLRETRQDYQEKAWDAFMKALETPDGARQALEPYVNGERPHSVAAVQYVRAKWQRLTEEVGII